MLEAELKANTEALKALAAAITANTAALGKGGAAAGSTGGKGATGGGKTDAGKTKPKHTYDQVKAALSEVKTTIDTDAARGIIQGTGESDNLAALANKPEKFDAVVAACKEAIENFEPENPGDEDL